MLLGADMWRSMRPRFKHIYWQHLGSLTSRCRVRAVFSGQKTLTDHLRQPVLGYGSSLYSYTYLIYLRIFWFILLIFNVPPSSTFGHPKPLKLLLGVLGRTTNFGSAGQWSRRAICSQQNFFCFFFSNFMLCSYQISCNSGLEYYELSSQQFN